MLNTKLCIWQMKRGWHLDLRGIVRNIVHPIRECKIQGLAKAMRGEAEKYEKLLLAPLNGMVYLFFMRS